MAVFHPESLVLRGVSVLSDGLTVGLRLGSYEKANPQAPKATPFSMRHPSPGCPSIAAEMRRRMFPTADTNASGNGAVLWAGRLSRAGVLGRRSPVTITGTTSLSRWSPTVGGPLFTAA